MKYIDADKLIAEIERLSKRYCDTIFDNVAKAALEKVYSIISSLQQEQPEKTLTFNGFVDKVGTWFANLRLDKFRKTFNGEIFPATQLVQEYDLFVQELSKEYSDKQEQPEVELTQKELHDSPDFEAEWKRYMASRKDDMRTNAVTINIKDVAKHFAEWGATHLKR